MPTHIVKQDEHISGITADYGFSDFHLIWDDAKNAKLKERRDPHVLLPGDEIFIPQKILKNEDGATTKIHTFQVNDVPLFLRLRILDINETAVKSAPYKLKLDIEDPARAGSTDGDGILTEKISPRVVDAALTVTETIPPVKKGGSPETEDLKFDVKVGHLNPITLP